MIVALRKVLRSQKGATAVEYGLICSLIVIAALGALGTLANSNTDMWNDIADQVVQD